MSFTSISPEMSQYLKSKYHSASALTPKPTKDRIMKIHVEEIKKEEPKETVWMDLKKGQAFMFRCHHNLAWDRPNQNEINVRTQSGFTVVSTGWHATVPDYSAVYVVDITELHVDLDLGQ